MCELIFYFNLYSAVWSSSFRGLDDWQVGRHNWENSHNHANHMMYPSPTCSLPFCICFCVPKDYNYAAGWRSPASVHFCFVLFFSLVILSFWSAFVWGETCCCCRTSSGLLRPCGCLCSDVDVLHCTSGSIRLSVLNNSLYFWENFLLLSLTGIPPKLQGINCTDVTVFSSR